MSMPLHQGPRFRMVRVNRSIGARQVSLAASHWCWSVMSRYQSRVMETSQSSSNHSPMISACRQLDVHHGEARVFPEPTSTRMQKDQTWRPEAACQIIQRNLKSGFGMESRSRVPNTNC